VETPHARPVGRALAELHTYRARQKLAAPASREDEAASLRLIADAIAQIHPKAAERAWALAQSLGEWLVNQPPAKRPIHGDFYSKQVVLQPDGTVAFLDLDEARQGDPAVDVGNFIAHLERYALSGRIEAGRAREVARELEKGYAGAAGSVNDHAVRTCTAACLFLLSPQPFRDRHPDWPQQMGARLL
jgi:aminoglycoside phosphotransferase (APT) family kinase protein